MSENIKLTMHDISDFIETAADLAEAITEDIRASKEMQISEETLDALISFAKSAEKLRDFITALQLSKAKLN